MGLQLQPSAFTFFVFAGTALPVALLIWLLWWREFGRYIWIDDRAKQSPHTLGDMGFFSWTATVIVVLFVTTCFTVLSWAIFFGRVHKDMAFVSKDRAVTAGLVPKGYNYFRWDNRFDDYDLLPLAESLTASMSLHPITINPKVRDLRYEVAIECGGSPEDLLLCQQAIQPFPKQLYEGGVNEHHRFTQLKPWLEYQLYEFNEQHSVEAAKFYNPLDQNQQEQFQKLLEGFLGPRLQSAGARFISANFSLASG